jgi:hypothetical protein
VSALHLNGNSNTRLLATRHPARLPNPKIVALVRRSFWKTDFQGTAI